MTQTEYCKHSGLSKGRVSQLVANGMPLTSPEEADAWRGSRKGIGGRPSNAQKLASIQQQEAVFNEAASSIPDGPHRPPEAAATINQSIVASDTPAGAYERQKQIERASYGLAVQALRNKTMDAGRMVGVHAVAAKNLMNARQDVIALAEKEKTLVSGSWVKRVMQDHDGAVASLLKTMPKQLAGRIAPHDPEHAERELDRWVQEVCLKTLHSTDPWK
jgi:hypothetical protein